MPLTCGPMTSTSPETEDSAEPVAKHKAPKKRSRLTAYIPLFLLTMLAGLAVLFFGHRISTIHDFDIACVRAASPSEGRLYDLDTESKIITSRLLSLQPDRASKFKMISITDDPDQVYESTPPSPLDYAVILHTLHERGVENIVLTTQMSWDGDLGITATALSNKLAEFEYAAIPLPLTRGATAQELPDILRQSIIPFTNIRGDQRHLPIVNQVALPSIISDSGKTRAGFSKIENLPENGYSIPMICLWQEEGILPSIELLTLMAAHKVSPDEVIIRCGEHIRLGLEGPVIQISKFGEVTLPADNGGLESIPTTKADALITRADSEKKNTTTDPHVYLIHGVGEKTKTTNALPSERLHAILHWAKSLPAPEPGKSVEYRRLPFWANIVIIFDIALTAWLFAGLSRVNRHLAFALTAAAIYLLLLSIMDVTQHWLSISAPLAAVIAAWITPVKRRKRTTNNKRYEESDPKPVIRA